MEAHTLLERELSKWSGYETVVCSSGTAALHLAVESLRLPPGSRVIVPDYTMVACPRAVSLSGHRSVFEDVRGRDLLIDPDRVSNIAHLDGVRAVMAVHLYGRACDMGPIIDTARKFDLAVIEDLAEAHGVHPHPESDVACWSFYRNKIVAGEEGGALCFPKAGKVSADRRRLARSLRSMGFTDAHDYTHVPRGTNYRMPNCCASAVLPSLAHVSANLAERRIIEQWYEEECPEDWKMPRRDSVWVYDFRIRGMLPVLQEAVLMGLRSAGVEARYGFKPMTSLVEWNNGKVSIGDCTKAHPESYAASKEVIYLPVRPGVTTREDCRFAFSIIKSVVSRHGPESLTASFSQ